MASKDHDRRSGCPIAFALDLVGDRWTLLVIRDLVFAGKRHFRDFLASEENIASNILAARLKTLEARGIVARRPDPDSGRQRIYELTDKGAQLIPALLELARWGAKYDAQTAAPRKLIRRIEQDRDGLVADLKSALDASRKR